MRNYFSIQRFRVQWRFPQTGAVSTLYFYEINNSGDAEQLAQAYEDYYNIDKKDRVADETYYEDLYFELDRFIVTRLLNIASFPNIDFDHTYIQKTSPRFDWSNNR
jgi:hypothetical protein